MTRVYLDNCVLNRPFDDQSQERIRLETEAIILLLARLERKEWTWLGSQALVGCIFLDTTHEAVELAEKLIEQNAIPRQAAEDALHIAVASVSGMNYLLTWNFKHIANTARRAGVELVCRLNNYGSPVSGGMIS
jgi:hypothetical protein